MKLKTKFQNEDFELGEVADVDIATMPDGHIKSQTVDKSGRVHTFFYDDLKTFANEWEDYEEPKSINEIDVVLEAIGEYCNEHSYYSGDLEKIKILNSVEDKLKAWKRLKDKGFRFHDWKNTADYSLPYDWNKSVELHEIDNDLDLLFGGEE